MVRRGRKSNFLAGDSAPGNQDRSTARLWYAVLFRSEHGDVDSVTAALQDERHLIPDRTGLRYLLQHDRLERASGFDRSQYPDQWLQDETGPWIGEGSDLSDNIID